MSNTVQIWKHQSEATGMSIDYDYEDHTFLNQSDIFKPAEMMEFIMDHSNEESSLWTDELEKALEDYYTNN